VANLKGDAAKAAFISHFKEVQRLKTQLDQYTDLSEDNKASIEQVLPEQTLRGFKGQYLETAKQLREQQGKTGGKGGSTDDPLNQIDFEFVLFASAVIDYDYIMRLIAQFSAKGPGKSKMTREELIGLISADAKFMNERDDIAAYIGTLQAGEGLGESAIREGYTRFKAEKNAMELAAIAARHGLTTADLQTFVDGILNRMIFDGEQLSDLMAPLDLGWKARSQAELALMAELYPLLSKRAGRLEQQGFRVPLRRRVAEERGNGTLHRSTHPGGGRMISNSQTSAAEEETKSMLVPKLRFPEFRGVEEWKPITLEEISTPVTERVGERKLTPVRISAGIGFVAQAEKFGRDISGNQYQVYTLVRDGDFVFLQRQLPQVPARLRVSIAGLGTSRRAKCLHLFPAQEVLLERFLSAVL
jgi:hypothetical protein